MPPFRSEISDFKGNPMLVVLCNGKPWGTTYSTDPEFQFGKTKALMILAIRDLLEEFDRTEGSDAASVKREVPNAPGLTHLLVIKGSAGFDAPNGHHVDKPYLTLTSGKTKISLGVNKAHALIAVWQDIEKFAA
jgi:hypothetical protein